ncbi:MAG: glycerophosphodiester phosphodiesterase [Spirochaetota bacterium]
MLDRIGTPAYPLVTGHRGAGGERPENSLEAFSYAAQIGCDGVELDVHLCRDGTPVVLHDPFLTRPDGSTVEIGSLSIAEVVESGSAVPSLEAVLEILAPTGLYVQIELKGDGVETAAVRLTRRYGLERRVILTSFVHRRVLTAKALLPEVRTGVLLSSVPIRLLGVARDAQADNIHLDHRRITSAVVEDVHTAGKTLVAWGVIKEDRDFDRLFSLGVDVIGSDWPSKLLARRRQVYGR